MAIQHTVRYPRMVAFRLSEKDAQKLEHVSLCLGLSPARVLRRFLQDVHPTGLPALTFAATAERAGENIDQLADEVLSNVMKGGHHGQKTTRGLSCS